MTATTAPAAGTDRAASRARALGARAGGSVLAWIERRLGLTATGVAVVVAAVIGLVIGNAIASRALFLLVYGAFASLGVAWVLGRRSLDLDTLRSELPSRVREGQRIEVDLRITARKRVSTIVLEERLSAALGTARRLAVPVLPAGQTIEHTYRFAPRLRGVYEVGPLIAEWSDPFGLTKRRVVLMDAVPLLVHPTVEKARDRVSRRAWEDPPVRPPESKPWPSGFEFYGMRDYVFGDDPRRIVWSATARTLDLDTGDGRYLVWEAEQGVTDQVTILLDTDREHHTPGDPSTTFETAVRAVASIGAYHVENGFSVSVEINGESLVRYLRGRRDVLDLLDELAAVELGREPLLDAVERTFVRPDRNTHEIVVTPHLDQRTAARLRLLLEKGTSVLVVLIVHEDTDPLVLHRAGTLGCPVVELVAGRPFGPAFQRVIGQGRS